MKLKIIHGKVHLYMKTGNDYVSHLMEENDAKKIINSGTVTQTTVHPGHPLTVDDKYYFEASLERKAKEVAADADIKKE